MTGSPWAWALRTLKGIPARTVRVVLVAALSQLGWFACVLGAAHGQAGPGVAVALAVLALMLWLSSAAPRDLALMALAVVVGLAWDSWLGAAGIVVYASPGPLAGVAPVWILALWALLGALLREPLAWLHRRLVVAAVLGGVVGALSYAGAVRLGAGLFPDVQQAMLVLGLGWAVLMPVLLLAARCLEEGGTALGGDGDGDGEVGR